MHIKKITSGNASIPCPMCHTREHLEYRWHESSGHGDSSFEGLCVYCATCRIGCGGESLNGYGSPEEKDFKSALVGWNRFMIQLKRSAADVEETSAPVDEEKRMFQVLDEMNLDDVKNETKMLQISTTYINMRQESMGCGLIMNVPCSAQFGIENGVTIPILIVVNKVEYFKRKGDGK